MAETAFALSWHRPENLSGGSDAMAGELFPCVEAQDRQAIRSIPYRARAALRKPVLGSGQQGGAANVCRETESGRRESRDDRSEEHTSELQSLMRISYAVFCLKKKNKRRDINTTAARKNKQI